jgi:hypothetical protein
MTLLRAGCEKIKAVRSEKVIIVCPAQQPACSGMRRHRRKNLKRTHADLDPFDPHDQLAGVDMKQLPWT